MNLKITVFLCSLLCLVPFGSEGQEVSAASGNRGFVSEGDPFGMRGFVENNGQFAAIGGTKVLFALDNGLEKIYFTERGLTYEFKEVFRLTHEMMEELEQGKNVKTEKTCRVEMRWHGALPSVNVEPGSKMSHYISYGEREFNSAIYKKLTYHSVYPGIDLEYVIPEDKANGIKYSFIVHPGADPSQIDIVYSGDLRSVQKLKDGTIRIRSDIETLIEHLPFSYDQSRREVTTEFRLVDGHLGFHFPQGFDQSQTLIIDPWVSTTSTLTGNSYAYDIDYDFLGNTYLYGGYNPFKVAMYSISGSLQWVFAGIVTSQGWSSAPITSQASNFGVNRFIGKTFIGQGYVGGGNRIIRLDASGNYDNFINSANSSFQEVWDMGFHCLTADVFVLGGGTSSNISATTINTVTAGLTLSTFQPGNNNVAQDVASHAVDDAANVFVLYAGITSVNNQITHVNSTFNGNLWIQPSGYTTFGEQQNKNQYQGAGTLSSNGFNALAVNANYLFYYNGANLAAINKSTGAVVATATVPGLTVKQQGGIAVDDCNNLYIGGVGSVLTYSFNGTSFSSLTPISLSVTSTSQYVYDIKLDKQVKNLYVCGSGFTGVYSPIPTLACPTASSMCLFSQGGVSVTTTSVSCSSLGTGTITPVGGTGPFTYTWVPSMQTGPVATGLNPGTHVIIVTDLGQSVTYTTTTYLAPLVPLSGTVQGPSEVGCSGITLNTTSIVLSGGSGTQAYLWTTPTGTSNAQTLTGLSAGGYSVLVIDALTSCSTSATFTITQPPPLTLTVFANGRSTCVTNSITLTPIPGGGVQPYTFSWSNGAGSGAIQASQSTGGSVIYTLTLSDSRSCTVSDTTLLNFIPGPVLTVNSPSICPQQLATLSAAGATSYTWNGLNPGATYTVSPAATTIYTVSGTGTLCTSTQTTQVTVMSTPFPTLTSNSPICQGQTLQLLAQGGQNYSWTGPLNFSSIVFNPVRNNAVPAHSGIYSATVTAANGCTASGALSVTVNPSPLVSAQGASLCAGQIAQLNGQPGSANNFYWAGPQSFSSLQQNPQIVNAGPSASGFYTLYVSDANLCSNQAVAHLSVTPALTLSFTSNSPLCEGQTLQLNASMNQPNLSYSWSGPSFSSNSQNPSISQSQPAQSGTYFMTAQYGPCQSTLSQSITIHPLPSLSAISPPPVCETQSIVFTVSAPSASSFFWAGPNNFTSTLSTVVPAPVYLSATGVYTVIVTDNNTCSNQTTVAAQVYPNPVLSVSDQTVCLFSQAIIPVAGAATYTWGGPGFFQVNNNNLLISSASNTVANTYTVAGTSLNNCTSSATVMLSTFPLPTVAITTSPSNSVCTGQEITLSGDGGENYEWRGPNQIYIPQKQIALKMMNAAFNGAYTLTVIDRNNCRASDQVNLHLLPLPDGMLIADKESACVPFCTRFNFYPSSTHSIAATWEINNRKITASTFHNCFEDPGTYRIMGKLLDLENGCVNGIEYGVRAYETPLADFSFLPQQPVENKDEVLFTSTSAGNELTELNWYYSLPDRSKKTSSGPETTLLFSESGIYPVVLTVKNRWGCADTVIKVIEVLEDFVIYVPNVFTPNGDAHNEVFKPVMRAVRSYHLSIYDRWGTRIFETTDPENGWDGFYRGLPAKSDVYTWRINVSSKQGENRQLSGHVTLYR